jgi:hypothetical protein
VRGGGAERRAPVARRCRVHLCVSRGGGRRAIGRCAHRFDAAGARLQLRPSSMDDSLPEASYVSPRELRSIMTSALAMVLDRVA